jgi:two-component system OmpR family sensor kinase
MDGRARLNRSLERALSRALSFAIVAAGVAATALAFVFGFDQAQDLQDEALRQIARLAAASAVAEKASTADSRESASSDPELQVLVVALASPSRPAWLAPDLAPGFHTLPGASEPMRVFVHGAPGTRIAVAQSTEVRREAALYSAAITLAPLAVLLPLLVWLARRITRTELSPLRHLAARLDQQLAERPEPLPAEDVPREIASFIEAINRLLLRVNELIAVQRRFIADAAHELRSPLTALAVQARNLAQAHSPQEARERVDALKAGIERARHLTEQLLDLARLQADGGAKERLDVSGLAREAIANCLPLAEQRGIDIGMEESASLTLPVHPASLRLIINNALDNALRYTPQGGRVTLRLAKQGSNAIIEVIDTGPGIPPDELGRIFAPFYRVPGAAGPGSGLGLAIARDAAERCGGSISVEPRADPPGTVFRYSQPLTSA